MREPEHRPGFLLSARVASAPLAAATALLAGCTLYSNGDRENFNAKAVVQNPTAVSSPTCLVKFAKPSAQDLGQDVLAIECFSGAFARTIVRVSR